ncbi:MAG TPA: type II secretion system F family protein [Tepidisphaeraceae bacterium]|nr:type II secretion system F family protein [Tepidisphaeraceae bacterium]
MEDMTLPIVIAGAVMLVVYAASQVIGNFADPERRKLKQRLSSDGTATDSSAETHKNIVLQQEAEGLTGVLVQWSFFDSINSMLIYASPDLTLSRFLAIATSAGLAAFMVTYVCSGSIIVSLVAAGIGLYAPCVWLSTKRSKRQRLLADQLPEALDFLSRILKAGHSLSTGLQMMSEELPQPLAGEFRRAYDQHSLGSSMDDCLKDMARRIDSSDFAFFVTAVLIQRQTGGDLSEVLGNISGMIRQRIRLQQHVKAKTAEGRFTGYILSAFPAVMFVIAYTLNPDYAGVLIRTSLGLVLLGVAFGLQLLGLYCIKKITTVTV